MKSTSKRLLALFLALTMCLSLLSVPVWAADVSGEASESAAVTQSEPEEAPADESAPEESEQAEESPDESPDASPEASSEPESEAEPEPDPEDVPDASPEASSEAESEADPEPDPEDVPDASPEASSEAEPEPEETVTVQDTHTHDSESFTAWEKTTSLPNSSGNYYLTQNVTLSSTWTVPSGGVKLCLNGKTVTGPTTDSVIKIDSGRSLSLYDESGGQIVGTATGDNRPTYGGGVYVNSNGSFTMKGGTITGCSATYGGGVCKYGSFTMNGGTISGCSAELGGGVCNIGSFTMKGGTITGCSASFKGGGVYVYTDSTFNLSGKPVITGNKKGGSINNGVLTGGTDNNVFLYSGTLITVTGALETGTKAGVTHGTNDGKGVFTKDWNTKMSGKDPSDYFTSDNGALGLALSSDGEAELTNHTHGSESFLPWNKTDCLPGNPGSYYLTADVTLSSTWEVPGGETKLCLNGHGITKTGDSGSVIQVGNDAALSLYDCDTTTEHRYTVNSDGVATVNDAATGEGVKTFTGGYLTGGRGTNDANQFFGGAVYVSGTFTMYGGTILGNCGSGGAGGGVFACQGGSFNLYGGAILGNYSYHGGGVAAGDSGTFAMYGGSVEGNAGVTGGGVYVENGGSFNLYGGSVVRNTGTVSGGVHVVEHGTMRLSSAQNAPALQIKDNTKSGTPSNLWLELWGGKQPVVTIANDTSYPLMRSDAKVGVTIGSRGAATDGKGVFTTGGQMTETLRKCFQSDNPAYAIHLTQNGEAEIGDHAHSYTYSANGNTITATCVGEGICPLTDKPELVLSGPSAAELIYDGAEKEASVSGSIPGVTTPTVVYTKEGDASFTGKPRDVGNYTASLTLGNATVTVSFAVAPKTVGLDWSDTSFTYNGKAHLPTATATGLVDGDTCAVTVTGEQTNAGIYTATATKLSNDNYTLPQEVTQGFTIDAKEVGLDWSDTNLTYNGSAQKPTATATGLVDGDACAVTVTGEQTNAGTYTATASKLSNNNYKLSQKVTQGFTIDPKVVGLDWSDTSFTYNGKAHLPAATATGLVDGDTCAVTVTGEQTNAGTYTATASKLSNDNYKLPQKVTQGFTIAKAQQAAPAAPVVKKVTQTSITVKAVSGQEYSRDGGKNWQNSGTFTGLTPDTAYRVRARLPGDANHEASAPSEASAARTKPQKKAVRHLGVRVTQTGRKLTVKWSKHTDVDTFEVRAAYCGKHFGKIPTVKVKVKTKKDKDGSVTITKLSGKVLKTNRNFRVQVVGKKDGKVVYRSAVCHIVGSRNRWKTNAKDIKKLPKTVTLKLSDKNRKTRQLRPKTVLQNPKRKQLGDDHAPEFRYTSSNERVAKVNKNGKITAKGEGECSIYVIARNGLQRRVTVTVKK